MQPVERTALKCPECGAALATERRCEEYLHDLLALEWQIAGAPGGEPHLFAVGTYNLQHPSGFLPAALVELCRTLADVLAGRASVDDARQRARRADGSTRVRRHDDTILSDEERQLLKQWPTRWTTTVRDVCDAPADEYARNVRTWALSTVEALSRVVNGAQDAVRDR